MSLCAPCHDELNRWLDHRKPLHYVTGWISYRPQHCGIQSHTRTHEILVSQVNLIRTHCAENHGEVELEAAA